jgi:hypothetical protein
MKEDMKDSKKPTSKDDTVALDSIHKELKILNEHLRQRNSKGRRFVTSLLTGDGTAIGAIVFAGILVFYLLDYMRSAESIPILGEIADVIENSINPK